MGFPKRTGEPRPSEGSPRSVRRANALIERWATYLADFHAERPGVTEEVLSRATAGGSNVYQWLARAVSQNTDVILDIGCGSGRMSRELARDGRTVIGLDMSAAELSQAAERSPGPWVLADARRLPFEDASMDAVTSSMGLAVIRPMTTLIAEIARVLRPGGVLAVTMPTTRPLRLADIRVAARITQILRSTPRLPGVRELALDKVLDLNGLRRVENARERYRYPIHDREDAERLIWALYLPTSAPERLAKAAEYLIKQSDNGRTVEVPIPMRRLVAIK